MPPKIFIKNKYNEKLAGLHESPKDKKDKYPTILLVHGFGVEKTEGGMFDQISERLISESYQTYRFDFAGCGESEGDYINTTLTRQAEDLDCILKYVREQEDTDKNRLGILGMSFGTAVITALHPKGIKAFAYLGSNSKPHESLKVLFGNGYNPTSISVRVKSNGQITKVGPEFWKDFDHYNLLDIIGKSNQPIIFIVGERDMKIRIENTKLYFSNANKPKELKIIENADHGFYRPEERKEMIDSVVKWFNKYLL